MLKAFLAAIKSPIFWTAVAALAASLSALFAAFYTGLTYRLVRSQREPNVVGYVKSDETRPTFLQIVVESIGRGLASNLHFQASRPIPSRAWGATIKDAKPAEKMTDGPLISDIRSLGPGDSRKITWGQYGGLMRALGREEIVLTSEYRNSFRSVSTHTAVLECWRFAEIDVADTK